MDKLLQDKKEHLPQESKVQLILSQDHMTEDEISLGELFQKILDGKKMIFLITLLALVVSSTLGGLSLILPKDKGKVQTIINFNFPGIEEGLAPDKEALDVQAITNKENLESTINALGLAEKGIDSDLLRENISIQGIIPTEIQTQMNLIEQMAAKDVTQLQRLQDIEIHPTQYKVTLQITKEMDLDNQEAEEVLTTIVNNYKTYFMNTYSDKVTLSTTAATTDASHYDYSEYILFIDNELKDIQTFLEEKDLENADFRSKVTGMSFSDLGTQVTMLRDIEVNNTQTVINTYRLTRNKERLISIYQNNIKKLTSELVEKEQMVQSLKKAARDYQKDKLVVMGKEDGQGNIEVPQGSSYYDSLMEQALNAEQEVNKIAYNKTYYEALMDQLTASNEEVVVDTTLYIQQVEESISAIQKQVGELIEKINRTVDEYYTSEVFKNSVKMDMPAMYESFAMSYMKKAVMIVAIGTCLGIVVGVMIALFKGLMSTDKAQEGTTYEA